MIALKICLTDNMPSSLFCSNYYIATPNIEVMFTQSMPLVKEHDVMGLARVEVFPIYFLIVFFFLLIFPLFFQESRL